MFIWLLLGSLTKTIAANIDKIIILKSISRRDYFYYMCVSMVPFSAAMMLLTPLRFEWHIIPFLLLISACIIRYFSQHSAVGMMRRLQPFQYQTYVTMAMVITYAIDCVIGSQQLNLFSILSIFSTITGMVIISDLKSFGTGLKKDILIRICCGILQGYITFYALKYWSNAFYILAINLTLTLVFARYYSFAYHKNQKEILKWIFLQQTFGFCYIYLENYLTSLSVTIGFYTTPTAIALSILLAPWLKFLKYTPRAKDYIGVALVIMGLLLLQR